MGWTSSHEIPKPTKCERADDRQYETKKYGIERPPKSAAPSPVPPPLTPTLLLSVLCLCRFPQVYGIKRQR